MRTHISARQRVGGFLLELCKRTESPLCASSRIFLPRPIPGALLVRPHPSRQVYTRGVALLSYAPYFCAQKSRDFFHIYSVHLRISIFRLTTNFFQLFKHSTDQEKICLVEETILKISRSGPSLCCF
jgi:hypothetical protein